MNDGKTLRRVLVVDDDEAIRRTLGVVLHRAGYAVTVARDGNECLRCLDEGFRGLVLLDIMMPVRDGWSTIDAIRKAGWPEGILVCMLTACSDPTPGIAGLEEFVFDYIVKPFDVDVLIDVVELALGQMAA